jgi:hypothetical protein
MITRHLYTLGSRKTILTIRNESNIVTISYYEHIMDAVIFNGPYNIGVEHRPIPTIRDPNDAIVKVEVAGICGSELHMYRGHQSTATGHIMVWPELELLVSRALKTIRLQQQRAMNSWVLCRRLALRSTRIELATESCRSSR